MAGLIMSICIFCIFKSDHRNNAEILILLYWAYFTHSSLLRANLYICFGIITTSIILIQFENKHSRDGKKKILPLILLGLFIMVAFYIKDHLSFSSFFQIT